ncbi:uncharacterized protein LOC110398286 isoform X1 [Numida meleagris]|uniref:uncharacterized protein LOC110398286 isoform X1 n=1 Tax=Numida meleagris TaxID=8996 RepID=UPI000B3DBA24|nr:uncharacterized protein LOC110398286 isoform X1 [Numida meleagris]XP_021251479.1 uncharacterized protein LOC110398286 isoform X1 [Numida meleagris]
MAVPTVVTLQPQAVSVATNARPMWQTGLMDCFTDWGVCCCGLFCFPCLACTVAGDMNECCLCGTSMAMRTLYRTRYNIPVSGARAGRSLLPRLSLSPRHRHTEGTRARLSTLPALPIGDRPRAGSGRTRCALFPLCLRPGKRKISCPPNAGGKPSPLPFCVIISFWQARSVLQPGWPAALRSDHNKETRSDQLSPAFSVPKRVFGRPRS